MVDDRPLLVVHDKEGDRHLIYDLLLLESGQEDEVMACFPRPVAQFTLPSWCCSFAVSGGTVVGAKYDWNDTMVHDTIMKVGGYDFWERQPSPRRRDAEGRLVRWWPMFRSFASPTLGGCHKDTPAMLPMRDGTVIRMDTIIFDGIYTFETLRLLPDGSWHAAPLPNPPVGRFAGNEVEFISAYFALGTQVWISVTGKGTFSLDTEHGGGTWRVEGTWELPFDGRALYVPELDSVIGFTAAPRHGGDTLQMVESWQLPFKKPILHMPEPDPVTGFTSRLLCAYDIKSGTLPVMRHVWKETYPWPWEECINDGQHLADSRPRDMPSLAYLGNGKFCICRPLSTMDLSFYGPPITYSASSFLVVQVKRLPGGELQLSKRGKMSYMLPPQGRECQYIGFIQPAT